MILLSSMKIFYNCTSPRFGPFCQYQLKYYDDSLYDILYDFSQQKVSDLRDLTCYEHLKCNRGPFPSCLDWSEICDGKIDCLDGGLDEKHCWELEMNECEQNEYRCRNGQCIPRSFLGDWKNGYDCLDGSDRYTRPPCRIDYDLYVISTGICEDVTCRSSPFTSSCTENRENSLMTARYSNEMCQRSFLCLIDFPYIDDLDCEMFCEENSCSKIIENNCSNILYFSSIPILFNDIYFAHTKTDL